MIIDEEYDTFIRESFWKQYREMYVRTCVVYTGWIFGFINGEGLFQYSEKDLKLWISAAAVKFLQVSFNLSEFEVEKFFRDEIEKNLLITKIHITLTMFLPSEHRLESNNLL